MRFSASLSAQCVRLLSGRAVRPRVSIKVAAPRVKYLVGPCVLGDVQEAATITHPASMNAPLHSPYHGHPSQAKSLTRVPPRPPSDGGARAQGGSRRRGSPRGCGGPARKSYPWRAHRGCAAPASSRRRHERTASSQLFLGTHHGSSPLQLLFRLLSGLVLSQT